MTDTFDTKQELFAYAVFRAIGTIFDSTDHQMKVDFHAYDFLTLNNGIYNFNFNGRHHPSDSLHELVEIAIRLVEKEITSRLQPGGTPYTIVKLTLEPEDEFRDAFQVLDRPNRVEMYTDTFRKGVANLRAAYGV